MVSFMANHYSNTVSFTQNYRAYQQCHPQFFLASIIYLNNNYRQQELIRISLGGFENRLGRSVLIINMIDLGFENYLGAITFN